MKRPQPDDFFKDWKEREALAEGMIPLIGKLYRTHNVSLYIYGQNLVNRSVTDLMQIHRYVRQIEHNELSEFETYPVVKALADMDLGPAHIDIGKLTVRYQESGNGRDVETFLRAEVGDDLGSTCKPIPQPQDVVLYGFGR
ncbi:MAG: glyceraldehyde-3-phosphate dehydrogenase, partial [Porticoccaceae bacterium]|nr:glyceraldehyde-3-phosphate dehydrogenase [Porticoccaceae bacterium]